ncbi:MAG: GUN4 domain-containing protein, partial [Sphaerospermopsis kisseleviana]
TIIGSAEYCAPEQSMGKPLFSSDLYSLGVTCLHLLTGVSPFDLYSPMEGEWVWRDFLNGNVVSDELGKILEKLASPIAKYRYQSVKEVMQELNFVDQNVRRSPSQILPPPPPPSQPPVKIPQPSVTVTSRYQKLEKLLAARKWKEADEETIKVMLTVANREKQRWLNVKSIDNFPCADLQTIDSLWVKYSNGKFGFSVQKRTYQSLGGTKEYHKEIWETFGDTVKWREEGKWLQSFNYGTIDINSRLTPLGHLPAAELTYYREVSLTEAFWLGWDRVDYGSGGFFILCRVETCGL